MLALISRSVQRIKLHLELVLVFSWYWCKYVMTVDSLIIVMTIGQFTRNNTDLFYIVLSLEAVLET